VKAATALQRFVERVDIIVLADCSPAMKSELPDGINLHVLRSRTSASPWAWAKVRRLLTRWKPQTVIGWSTYANFVAIVTTRKLHIQTVVVSERNYVPKIVSASDVGAIRRCVVVRLMKWLYRRADIITANSEDCVRFLRKFIGAGPRYAHLPNIINMHHVVKRAGDSPEVSLVRTQGPHLLAVGRLQPQKGFDLLLEALARVRASCPWGLVLVGDGPERVPLQRLARDLGIEQAVQWVGSVANPFPYYHWADLVIVPSRFEGFPNVALEAMSCGRTVICFDCRTGPRELTQNGTFGVLVPSGDVGALARAILDWGCDAERRKRMGERACDHVRTRYDSGLVGNVFAHVLSCGAAH
jgi:glycosyltransferase involved in cell wall biosynthesis